MRPLIEVVQRVPARTNWRKGPEPPRPVRAVALHVTEGSADSVYSHFANPKSEVSAHFMVRRDGGLDQFVGIHDIAYHAGRTSRPTWPGLRMVSATQSDTNATTVGIEHEGDGVSPWTEPQLLTSSLLSAWLAQRFQFKAIDPLHYPLHREIFADKTCPGSWFQRDPYLHRVDAALTLFGASLHDLIVGIR